MKKIYKIILITVLMCLSYNVQAIDINNSKHISNYSVEINVDKYNISTIKETIDYYSPYDRRGIYRFIPLKNRVYRAKLNQNKYAYISDLKSNVKYTTEVDDIFINIKMFKNFIGKNRFILQYKFHDELDDLSDIDEYYFNIIGDKTSIPTTNYNFKITFPKKIDPNKVYFLVGNTEVYGNTNSDILEYRVKGNTIYGNSKTILQPNTAVTIRALLPQGYFKEDNRTILPFIICLITSVIISTILWIKHYINNKEDIVEPIVFYPPENMSPLKMAVKYKRKINPEDYFTLMLILDTKKYIKVENYDDKYIKITKLKEADEFLSDEEVNLYNILFEEKDEYILKKFNEEASKKIKSEIYSCHKKYYVKYTTKSILCTIILSMLFLIPYIILFLLNICNIPLIKTTLILLGFHSISLLIFYFKSGEKSKKKIFRDILIWITIYSLLYVGICYILFKTLIVYVICLILNIYELLLIYKTKTLMPEEQKLYGQILGFRNFLIDVKEPQLQLLVDKDPRYFFKILPYTYVLSVSTKWVDKFKNIEMTSATANNYTNDYIATSILYHNIMNNITGVYELSNINTSGNFSSGEFSGGGVGGGGIGSF